MPRRYGENEKNEPIRMALIIVRQNIRVRFTADNVHIRSLLNKTAWTEALVVKAPQHRKQLTFVNEILRLQVKTLAVTLSPQTGDGGVKLAAAVRLHGRRRSRSVALHARFHRFPLIALWRHLERQVVI